MSRNGVSAASLVFLLFLAREAVAGPAILQAGKVDVSPGAEVSVPIAVRNGGDTAAVQLELLYDPALLEAKKVVKDPRLPHSTLLESGPAGRGRLSVSLTSLEALPGDGTLMSAVFAVRASAGARCVIGIENARAWRASDNSLLEVTAEAGLVQVGGGNPGPPGSAAATPAAPPSASGSFSWFPFLALVGAAVGVLLMAGAIVSIRNRSRGAPQKGGPPAPPQVPRSPRPAPRRHRHRHRHRHRGWSLLLPAPRCRLPRRPSGSVSGVGTRTARPFPSPPTASSDGAVRPISAFSIRSPRGGTRRSDRLPRAGSFRTRRARTGRG